METVQPGRQQGGQFPRQRSIPSNDTSSDYADSVVELPESLLAGNDEGLVDNPLLRLRPDEVERLVHRFVKDHGLVNQQDVFIKAGKILRDPEAWQSVPRLSAEEKVVLQYETRGGFWSQPKGLQVTIITLCVAAIVQGWNQTGTNGANLNWPEQMGLTELTDLKGVDKTGRDTWIFGIVNAAPYLSASLVGCWLSDPLNEYFFGRRAAICVSAAVIMASVVGGACTHTWQELLVCRILLGIGMGCKASVVPVFAAEVAPAHIRGSLVMNWQLFDAFGIFLGFTANLVVSHVGHTAWRWQIASSVLPTIVLLSLIYVCPESPRFLMKRGHYQEAYQSLILLRFYPILAAKELFYIHCQREVEANFLARRRGYLLTAAHDSSTGNDATADDGGSKKKTVPSRQSARPIDFWQKLSELFTIPRNRRALIAAVVCMISQQLCGVNVLVFFSSTFFRDASNQPRKSAYMQPLFLSWGLGLANFVFAFPAYYFIDSKGRRWLLLVTIPLMALSILGAGMSFLIPADNHAHGPVIAFWTFVFFIFYSCGMGPVPFTLSAEVFPLESRVVGMSFAVFCNLFGAGILALFVPPLTIAIDPPGLLGIFAFLNVVAFFLVFFFVRETAGAAVGGSLGSMISVSLEELNYIFAVSTAKHAVYQIRTVLPWAWQYYIKRDKSCSDQPQKLYQWADARDQELHVVPRTV
ncbi:hypothetical protein LTR08_001561 [Meristemomyces frigidus]|nr:hypothetical protein LTR08_001561 [Meristemomyces frigidus]